MLSLFLLSEQGVRWQEPWRGWGLCFRLVHLSLPPGCLLIFPDELYVPTLSLLKVSKVLMNKTHG